MARFDKPINTLKAALERAGVFAPKPVPKIKLDPEPMAAMAAQMLSDRFKPFLIPNNRFTTEASALDAGFRRVVSCFTQGELSFTLGSQKAFVNSIMTVAAFNLQAEIANSFKGKHIAFAPPSLLTKRFTVNALARVGNAYAAVYLWHNEHTGNLDGEIQTLCLDG